MLFSSQAERFIQESQTRRRNPIRPQSAKIYQSYLDAHVLPFLGGFPTYTIENGVMRNFIQHLSEKKLSASTVCQIFNLVAAVTASEVDENGNECNPRKWNHDFIDLPIVNRHDTRAQIVTPEQIEAALAVGSEKLRALLVLLASTGLRIGEALALEGHLTPFTTSIGSYWDIKNARIVVKTTLVKGKLSPQPKTDAGRREIDLHPAINDYLKSVGLPSEGFLFQNSLGSRARVETLYDQLEALGLDTGFHAFRRFRATHLEAQNTPRSLTSYWLGHSGNSSITDRYIKIGQDLETRKKWAEKVGFGFSLEEKL